MAAKLIAFSFIFFGEVFVIIVEILGARWYGLNNELFSSAFFKLFVPVTIGTGVLLAGYMLGQAAFENIWIVSAISIGSVAIAEPIVAYALTGQLPTLGAGIGFILGVLGLVAASFW